MSNIIVNFQETNFAKQKTNSFKALKKCDFKVGLNSYAY